MRILFMLAAVLLGQLKAHASGLASYNNKFSHKLQDAYIAFDAGLMNTGMTRKYRELFYKNYFSLNLGIGYYFNDLFSMELNHFWNDGINKKFTTTTSTPFLGLIPTRDNVHLGKFSIITTAFEMHYNLFRGSMFQPFIGAGICWGHQKIRFKHVVQIDPAETTEAIMTPLSTMTSVKKTRIFFRGVVGLNASLTKSFGVRFLYRYDNISRIAITSSIAGLPSKPLHGGNFFSIGLFYSFYS